ncbi:MAG: peptidoglycan DD-metalloendopeptidase family protein [Myxococcota bacterium]
MKPVDALNTAHAHGHHDHDHNSVAEAADGFESLLWGEVTKAMRRAVGGEDNFARSIYTSMLDEQLAQILAEQTTGLDTQLQRQFGDKPLPMRSLELLDAPGWAFPVGGRSSVSLSPGQMYGADRGLHRPAGHVGVDLGRAEGTPVFAARSGTVTAVNRDPDRSGGRWIEVNHGAGVRTRYLHLHEVEASVAVGSRVFSGEPIGSVGNTGPGSKGNHLHFEIRVDVGERREPIDPTAYLKKWTAP